MKMTAAARSETASGINSTGTFLGAVSSGIVGISDRDADTTVIFPSETETVSV